MSIGRKEIDGDQLFSSKESRLEPSRVITRIKDPSYSDVHPSEIQLLVIANIYLIPSDMVYLIRQATISYSVNILKGQQMRENGSSN